MLSNQMHNKARHNSTASCAGLAHSSLACACRRYEREVMKFMKTFLFLALISLVACSINKPLPLYYEDSDRVVRVAHEHLKENSPEMYSEGVKIVSVRLPRHKVKNNIVVSFEPINKDSLVETISGDYVTIVYTVKLIAIEFTTLGKFVSIKFNEMTKRNTRKRKI
jgi:hypothetical protein